jgi:hypothetical protein
MDRWEDVQKTAAEGAKDDESLLESHLEAPNEVDGEHPQSNLNDKADDFDPNPSNILKNVRPSRPKKGRMWIKATIASEPSNVAQG